MIRNLILLILIVGCNNDYVLPKPKAYLYEQFEENQEYYVYDSECGFSFIANKSSIIDSNGCNLKMHNTDLKSTIFFTIVNVEENISLIQKDFDNKLDENSKNAFYVKSSEYVNSNKKIYAKYFTFSGDTPSSTQFFITDSISKYISGSLFFESKPNYDSLLPSIEFTNNEIRKLIQSFNWN